jgi:Zn-dependent protease/predicted transcriptional regulator
MLFFNLCNSALCIKFTAGLLLYSISCNFYKSYDAFKDTFMSFQIAKVKGIPVRLHFTLIIVFFLIAWTLASSFMPRYFPNLTTVQYWIMGATGAIILFISVFLHELMHSVMALRYGVKVRQIILFIFGGVSEIPEETRDFRKEFKIAIAGPAASFAIAAVLAVSWWLVSQITPAAPQLLATKQVVEGILLYGAIINIMLGAFNLIPAFPLDGGRILRAGLVAWKKDYDSATRIAARVGIAISYGFMGVGFLTLITGSFISGIWILLIGWFLNSGAQSYLSQHELTSVLAGVRLKDIMNTKVIAVRRDVKVDELLKEYFAIYMKSSFPVIDYDGRMLGMVTLKRVHEIPEDKRQQLTAGEIMIPLEDLVVMLASRSADEALMKMTRTRIGKVFVCDPQGVLLGLVSKTDIMNMVSERQEFQQELKKFATNDSKAV